MSRIGKLKIDLPKGATVDIKDGSVKMKGGLGEMSWQLPPGITVEQDGSELRVVRAKEDKKTRALHGLSRALIANMAKGVTEGFSKTLEIQGVGYKAEMKKDKLALFVGYSHPVEFEAPEGITLKTENPTTIVVSGIDKGRVGQVSADIRKFRPPDAYKGKGIRYKNEKIKLKPGKSGA
ncbi:MAG TPA: 50S ribosomal protein L6 [bacterium]|nr:50S ribosomal protein L6 [bacterium]HPN93437.1 50S ribosomal protein L6 [bacterium]